MILQSLARLAEREGLVANPDYEVKEVHWRISVTGDGRFVGLESLLQESETGVKRARPRGPSVEIPRPFAGARPSGVSPDSGFLVGNASFLLGVDLSTDQKYSSRRGELERRFEQFTQLIVEAVRATGDEGVAAVAALLSSPTEVKRARDEVAARAREKLLHTNHLLTFGVVGDGHAYVHQRPAVVEYWSRFRSRGEVDYEAQCLVTGAVGSVIDKHPPIRKLPGGTPSGVAIVSFNCAAFESYGFERNDNAPVSRRSAEAYTAALNRLLDPSFPDPRDPNIRLPEQRVKLSDDTVAVFWTDGPTRVAAAIAPAIASGNPEAVRELGAGLELDESYQVLDAAGQPPPPRAEPIRAMHDAPWKGISPQELEDPGAFRLLILSGGQGRATVRAFHTTRVRETVKAVRDWFRDVRIQGLSGPPALYRLLRTLAERGEPSNLPPDLAGELFLAILGGRPLPVSILEAAVRRCRSDPGRQGHGRVPAERAALVKAYTNRARPYLSTLNIRYEEVKPAMNDAERNKGYLLGRMLACMERMQELALGEVGATITDRYFGAACATPQAVFPRLLKTEVHHYRKACEGQWAGSARWLHSQISGIAMWLVGQQNDMGDSESIDAFLRRTAGRPLVGFPAFLPLPEQGLFVLGYHQQRAEFFKKRQGSAYSNTARGAQDSGGQGT
jgi:CRISPR-associated protein Csd1